MTAPSASAPTHTRKPAGRGLLTIANVATAVAALGVSIALGLLLPLTIYKFFAGAAGVTAVLATGILLYRRTTSTTTDDTTGR